MSIRQLTLDDLPALKALIEASFSLYIPRMGKRPAPMDADFSVQIKVGQWYGLGRLLSAAICHYSQDGSIWHVETMAVAEDARGQGLGRSLVTFAEDQARQAECTALELYTNVLMHENLSLYRHLGFAETHRREEGGFSRVYFRKEMGCGRHE